VFDITPIYNVKGAILMDRCHKLANRDAIYVDDLKDKPLLAFGSASYYRI
jgi:hypothetical protein